MCGIHCVSHGNHTETGSNTRSPPYCHLCAGSLTPTNMQLATLTALALSCLCVILAQDVTVPTGDPSIVFDGTWVPQDNGGHEFTTTTGSSASLSFIGELIERGQSLGNPLVTLPTCFLLSQVHRSPGTPPLIPSVPSRASLWTARQALSSTRQKGPCQALRLFSLCSSPRTDCCRA